MGARLLPALAERGFAVVATDLSELPEDRRVHCVATAAVDLLDAAAMTALIRRHPPTQVLHLAALLSSAAERDPDLAHRVNVDGTLGLIRICRQELPTAPLFMFPSSIAVYGLPDPAAKAKQGAVGEWEWTIPAAVYGCNKLYCELLGALLSRGPGARLDFRAIRFPGLISAETLPTGGTTDYAPEMLHAAAQGKPYSCFVAATTRLPFMTMPDAVDALLALAGAPAERLTRRAYNVRGFSVTAAEIRDETLRHFPSARIEFDPVAARQAIVDSWPADIDDSAARRDWGFAPRHGFTEALADYLIPELRNRYKPTLADTAPRPPAR